MESKKLEKPAEIVLQALMAGKPRRSLSSPVQKPRRVPVSPVISTNAIRSFFIAILLLLWEPLPSLGIVRIAPRFSPDCASSLLGTSP